MIQHTEPSRLFRSLRMESHDEQLHASIAVILWFYRNHPLHIVERHMPRIITALVSAAVAWPAGNPPTESAS